MPHSVLHRRALLRRLVLVLAAATLLAALLPASPAAAAEGLTMDARVLLKGQARVGSWVGIEVRLANGGPSIVGELRVATGQESRTRYSTPVDLPTTSDKTYVLYGQPPTSFGSTLRVSLVTSSGVLAEETVDFTVNDSSRLVVGVVAERPEAIIPNLNLLPANANGQIPNVLALGLSDLPERVEAWGALDRLIWHDVDATDLTDGQLTALRGWLAGGGRLVIAGGTAGPSALARFPDDILPFRPLATVDVPAASISGLIGQVPENAPDIPMLAGELVRGRALASSGDQTIAAEAAYGGGLVTLLGFDPTTEWILESEATETFWRRFLPPRASIGGIGNTDDGQLVNAVSQLPNLALPPIGGLLVLLLGYIVLIGPVNYLVLRRLDRREWAWITMPVLIAVFAAGSYGFGAALRGLDVVINEVAVVRGAPNATEGTAQVYLGVFSPSRGTYQLEVPGGALLSSTLTGDFISSGSGGSLDVVQGETARIRDLAIGFGSLRTLRAETTATVPLIQAALVLRDGMLTGTVTNGSEQVLEKPAIVLASSVVVLDDLAPGATATVSMAIRPNDSFDSLSNRILGQIFFRDPAGTDVSNRNLVRHAVIDQLTFDPVQGRNNSLGADVPVLLAWGRNDVLDISISGQAPRRTGNVLYYVPLGMQVRGATAFDGELLRSSVVSVDGGFFNKEPFSISMGRGEATLAYRPIAFDGTLEATALRLSFNWGEGQAVPGDGQPLVPMDPQPCRDEETDEPDCAEPEPPDDCDPALRDCFFEQIPAVELFDLRDGGRWVRMEAAEAGRTYSVPNPGNYVDPGSGTVLVRFVTEFEQANFGFQVRIEGNVS